MNVRDVPPVLDPTVEAILHVQRELLMRLGTNLLSSQRSALATLQAEMDHTSQALSESMALWRKRMVGIIWLNTSLLVPWIAVLGLLAAATLVLGVKTRDAWSDYRSAAAAVERMRAHGAVTVEKGGRLYVRVDPESLSRGRRGNWYAEAVGLELGEDEEPKLP
jgi:hypothetical protein